MAKTIFEELGGRYERQGDYLIPCLTLPAEKEQPIGLFGRRHLDYLKQHRRVTYINLLTSGRLNTYLADIDRQAQERFERLIESTKQAQGITERLKAENALEWTGRLNNIRACAMEIVNEERVTPKGVDELIIEQERSELLRRTIAALPEIQRRRFLLYYEYDFNYYEIAAMEHCTASSVGKSISIAKEKIREQMKKYLCP